MKAMLHSPVPVMDYQQFRKMRRMVHSCCNYDGGKGDICHIGGWSKMEQSLQVMSKQERLENWTTRIMACRSSGMTVRAWCRENGLSEKTYYDWQRRLFLKWL